MRAYNQRIATGRDDTAPPALQSMLALLLCALLGCVEAASTAGGAATAPAGSQAARAQSPDAAEGRNAAPKEEPASAADTAGAAAQEIDKTAPPTSLPNSQRPPAEGEWRPTALLPNDLTDPPKNYRRCAGGACFGMSSVTYALWLSPLKPGVMTVEDAATRVVYDMIPNQLGRFDNHPLPAQVLIDGRLAPTLSRKALTRLVETVQNLVQPGGASPKTPGQIRRIYQTVQADPRRFLTVEEAKRRLESCGGRDVVGLSAFNPDLTRLEGHAVLMTLGADGNLYVWDPNAKMDRDVDGSGKLALVQTHVGSDGRLRGVSYAITLPNGERQKRFFTHVMPSSMFVSGVRLPAFPQRMLREGGAR